MNNRRGIRITLDFHYPIVEALMELTHYDNVDDLVNYIDNMLSSAANTTVYGSRIRGTEKEQDYAIETFDVSNFQLEYDWMLDEEE